jgi:succinoglycan biosynthesis transport protein ExoP
MEIKFYFSLARRWAWLLVIGLVFGALVGFLGSIFQTPIYQSSTRILVLRASQQEKNTDSYLSDQQLVQTYIQLLGTRPVLEGTSLLLGYNVNSSQVAVSQIRDMQAIQVTVEDPNPQHAADIANALVQVLIKQNETIQTGRYTLTEQSIEAQISQIEAQISQMSTEIQNVSLETVQQQQQQVEAQIATMQAEVSQLQSEIQQLSASNTPEQQALLIQKQARLAEIQPVLTLSQKIYTDLVVLGKPADATSNDTTRLSQLQTTMQLYQEIYVNLLNNLEAIRLARLQNTPNVVQIESATVPSTPVRPRPVSNMALAAVLGLLLAGGIAFMIDYLDDTVRTPDEVERIFNLPIIGYIGDIKMTPGEVVDGHVMKHPRSPVSEAFRSLRTNLEFANVDRPLNKILIASSGPGEGKTTVATSLATIMAQGGRRVLLIDADMRRPRIHSVFGISNRIGLSSLFRANTPVRSAMQAVPGLDNLFIIPSGNLPPNPTELLASARMNEILNEASQEVDVIVVDSPPSLVADYQVLATKMDGVILVVQPGFTHIDAAIAMLEQLKQVNARTLGVVLNKIQRHNHYYPYKRGDYYIQQGGMEIQAPVQMIQPEYRSLLPKAPPLTIEASLPQTEVAPLSENIQNQNVSVHHEEEPHQFTETYSTFENASDIHNVAETKPEIPDLIFEPVEPEQEIEDAVFLEDKTQRLTLDEANEFVIKNYKLEYWVSEE